MRGVRDGVISWLAGVRLAVVGGALVLGSIAADAHTALVRHSYVTGAEEWPQWVGRLTVQSYWVVLPLALMALWARRRGQQGRWGRAGAALLAVGPVSHLVITVAAVLWGGVLGRGDLPTGFMAVEALAYLVYLGVLAAGIALLRDRGVPKVYGVLVLAGFVASFPLPWAMSAVYALLAALLVRDDVRSARREAGAPTMTWAA